MAATAANPNGEKVTRILIPSGVLGLGFDPVALARGVAMQPDAICIDGGSTDSGPYYLGTGSSKYSEAATRGEWQALMLARHSAGVPLILGSCGTCGSDSMVDWMYDITLEIARELGQSLRIARLYSSQSCATILNALQAGRVSSLLPTSDLDNDTVNDCTNIVALAGAEQITEALASGADIILAGRTTDTAVISALPIHNGADTGGAWHGAKIGECGALCSTQPTSGVILIDFDAQGFTVQPLATDALCTPHSVSAHMLYENSDPIELLEPGGALNVSSASYTALDERTVRVSGSVWQAHERYTVKLEGAGLTGYQTSSLVLLRQPDYVANAQLWCDRLHAFLVEQIKDKMSLSEESYDLEFRLIGVDATLGLRETRQSNPVEVGVLTLVTAASQALATDIARLCNPFLLHFPLSSTEALPTFAFPYSPAESERGAVYQFMLNHVLELDAPMDAFKLQLDEVRDGKLI